MSSVRRSRSFSLVKTGTDDWDDDSSFLLDASDLNVMHDDFGRYLELGGVQGIARALRTNPKTGLFFDEVTADANKLGAVDSAKDSSIDHQFWRRKVRYGRNVYPKPPLKTFLEHCWNELQDPMLLILLVAASVSTALGIYEGGSGWTEGVAIYLAVCIVTFVGAFNNLQQEKAFRKLEEDREEPSYRVIRSGEPSRVWASQLVVGDLVELSAGDAIPADGIFVYGDDPACDESKMTGESIDVPKDSRHPFLKAGTEVKTGQFGMIITAVGKNSSYGRIMLALAKPPGQTPLQEKLDEVAELVGYIGGGVAIVLFIVLTSFWLGRNDSADAKDEHAEDILEFFIIAVTIVVVAIPEGLPLAVTISLAYSMKKMVADQNLVRVLSACETMGNATTICSDKTGTLTQNIMTVVKGWIGGSFESELSSAPELPPAIMKLLVEGVIVNSKARPSTREDGKVVWHEGNETEVALMQWLQKYGLDVTVEAEKHIVLKNYPFDSAKKNSSVILRVEKEPGVKVYRRYFKGAAEVLFHQCSLIVDNTGGVSEIEPQRDAIEADISKMTCSGLRSIGFAYQEFNSISTDPADPSKILDPTDPSPFVFVGVVGIQDPLRPESRASVRACQRAGVIVRMVTGDHLETARFIARECGILTCDEHLVMEGKDFRKLLAHKAEAEAKIPMLRVLARSSPEDKQNLVAWLKEHGHVVAATGDGTNDAPALKEAHVGIAMNLVGTEVAKSAAEILILDDNFSSIVKAVMWGRSVFDNIRKFVQFQLTVNVVALGISLIGAFTQYENPLKAVQLLWVNLIMDTMAALALGTEIPTMALLERRPYSRDAPLISRIMWRNILAQSAFQLVWLMIVLYAGTEIWDLGEDESVKHFTMVFNVFVWLQVFNEINSRKVMGERDVFSGFFANPIFSIVLAVTAVFQALMIETFGSFAETTGLGIVEWVSCIAIGASCIPFGAIVRLYEVPTDDGMIDIDTDVMFKNAKLDEED